MSLTKHKTGSANPKVYVALLTQTGTNAPTAIVLENTLDEIPTFSYNGVGDYYINTVGDVFTANKTTTIIAMDQQVSTYNNQIFWANTKQVRIAVYDNGVEVNGFLGNTLVEIRVYP